MAKHEVHVEIDEKGEVTVEAKGIKGRGCLSIIGDLLKAVGAQKGPSTPTKEMYEAEPVKQKVGG